MFNLYSFWWLSQFVIIEMTIERSSGYVNIFNLMRGETLLVDPRLSPTTCQHYQGAVASLVL